MELVLPAVAVRRGPEGDQISYVAALHLVTLPGC
jgi:hypothetical protein